MGKLARVGVAVAVAVAVVLTACSDSGSSNTEVTPTTSPTSQPAVTTTAVTQLSQPTVRTLGEPFMLDDLRVTMLSVQDPFSPTAQVHPAFGNRLVSIRYEVVSQDGTTRTLSDLPTVELRDSTGASYQSEHGRLSVVGGSRAPGELPSGKSVETSAVFEVPGSATGLRVAFRSLASPGRDEAVVILD